MKTLLSRTFMLSFLAVAACAQPVDGEDADEAVGQTQQAINDGFPDSNFFDSPFSRSTVAINNGQCTGVIVAPQVVLSAAHCFSGRPASGTTFVNFFRNGVRSGSGIRVDMVTFPDGINMENPDCTDSPFTNCDDIKGRLADLAVLHLASPIPSDRTPALIPTTTTEGQPAMAVGAGLHDGISSGGTQLFDRRTEVLSIINPASDSDGVLWAADSVTSGKSGDSGGPLYAMLPNGGMPSDGQLQVLGIVRGKFWRGASAAFRTRYTSVRDFASFINLEIGFSRINAFGSRAHVLREVDEACGGNLKFVAPDGEVTTIGPTDKTAHFINFRGFARSKFAWTCDGTNESTTCPDNTEAITVFRPDGDRDFVVQCKQFPWQI
jgi:Trypsin